MVSVSPGFQPPMIIGLKLDPVNPLQFDFIVNTGDTRLGGEELRLEANKLIKYFMASLTVPENELWVNLSPYEKNRIISDGFGQTSMGRDLLAQDYILKQLTASLIHPDKGLGKEFWDRVYAKAQEMYGTTDIPVNTFNKIWILPDKATIYEHQGAAYLVESHLRVMLEEDYAAMAQNLGSEKFGTDVLQAKDTEAINEVSSAIVREILIPEIQKEVNEGKTFANLRQIMNSLILAIWFKENLRESLLGQVYVDKNKVLGIDVEDKTVKEQIYQQYLEAFKIGVYDFLKEEYDPVAQEVIPRKYFSGGVVVQRDQMDMRFVSEERGNFGATEQRAVDRFVATNGQSDNAMISARLLDVGQGAAQAIPRENELARLPGTGDEAMLGNNMAAQLTAVARVVSGEGRNMDAQDLSQYINRASSVSALDQIRQFAERNLPNEVDKESVRRWIANRSGELARGDAAMIGQRTAVQVQRNFGVLPEDRLGDLEPEEFDRFVKRLSALTKQSVILEFTEDEDAMLSVMTDSENNVIFVEFHDGTSVEDVLEQLEAQDLFTLTGVSRALLPFDAMLTDVLTKRFRITNAVNDAMTFREVGLENFEIEALIGYLDEIYTFADLRDFELNQDSTVGDLRELVERDALRSTSPGDVAMLGREWPAVVVERRFGMTPETRLASVAGSRDLNIRLGVMTGYSFAFNRSSAQLEPVTMNIDHANRSARITFTDNASVANLLDVLQDEGVVSLLPGAPVVRVTEALSFILSNFGVRMEAEELSDNMTFAGDLRLSDENKRLTMVYFDYVYNFEGPTLETRAGQMNTVGDLRNFIRQNALLGADAAMLAGEGGSQAVRQLRAVERELEVLMDTREQIVEDGEIDLDAVDQAFAYEPRVNGLKRQARQLRTQLSESGAADQAMITEANFSDRARALAATQPQVRAYTESSRARELFARLIAAVAGQESSAAEFLREIGEDIELPQAANINKIADLIAENRIDSSVHIKLYREDAAFRTVKSGMERVKIAFLPMKGDPWQEGHVWLPAELVAKFANDKTVIGIDNSDPKRKPNLKSLAIREAASQPLLEINAGMMEYSPLFKEQDLLTVDGERAIFRLMMWNQESGIDFTYIAGSDHARWVAKKMDKDTGYLQMDVAQKLFRHIFQGLYDVIAASAQNRIDPMFLLSRMVVRNYIGSDLQIVQGFSGFDQGFTDYIAQVEPMEFSASGLNAEQVMDHLRQLNIIDQNNRLDAARWQAFQTGDAEVLRGFDQFNVTDRQVIRFSLDRVAQAQALTEGEMQNIVRAIQENRDARGVDGYQRGGAAQLKTVVFSQRVGEEVPAGQIRALSALSGLDIQTVDQPMETSSTRVRDNGHFWTMPGISVRLAKAFQLWGFETPQIAAEQQAVSAELKSVANQAIAAQLANQDTTELMGRIRTLLQSATGLGIDQFDSYVNRLIIELTDAQYRIEEDILTRNGIQKDGNNAALVQYLEGIRELTFDRARSIVASADSVERLPLRQQDIDYLRNRSENVLRQNAFASDFERDLMADLINFLGAESFSRVTGVAIDNVQRLSGMASQGDEAMIAQVDDVLRSGDVVAMQSRMEELIALQERMTDRRANIALQLTRGAVAGRARLDLASEGEGIGIELDRIGGLIGQLREAIGRATASTRDSAMLTRRILYVEDEPDTRELTELNLQDAGHTVVAVSNGIEALDVVRQNAGNFDVVITDIRMPGMDGITLTERLEEEFPELPVIMVTGSPDDVTNRPENLKEVVTKPYSRERLNSALADALPDQAMIGRENVGGIDLNPALLDLQIKRDGNGIPLPLNQQPLQQMHIQGFVPVIINVTPINLPVTLGLGGKGGGSEYGAADHQAREPEKVSFLN